MIAGLIRCDSCESEIYVEGESREHILAMAFMLEGWLITPADEAPERQFHYCPECRLGHESD
ncbi:MAG TPA: hypothetical protein VEI03_12235 [Stellaceae bacterium]|nr:hypothetical protein [Stellaceae bacterium]